MAHASPRLVLASTSKYRRALLDRLVIPFTVNGPLVDETVNAGEDPIALVHRLSKAKAQAVAEFERAYLGHLMARTSGNISLAARLAGTDRGSLQKLVKKHGILGDRFKPLAPEPRRALPRPRLVR